MLDWERNWRGAGIVFAVLIIIASIIYGSAPKPGAGSDQLVLLGGTTWATNGFWAPDGGYALISRIVLVAWIAVISGFLYMRSPSAVKVPDRAAVPTA
jgi:hypothetical protein